ncbi:MAG: ctaE [Rickettsiales bacterium]|jgi:cytochrome c oxidase subunit 3|nr:ctaE [Rickettsiales bacterium]
MSSVKHHDYHLVDPSPWPLLGALSAATMFVGLAMFMHNVPAGKFIAPLGLALVLWTMYVWWRDVVREGIKDKAHTDVVRKGLRFGMLLFICSEVMFFVAFFWAFFNASLNPAHILEEIWPIAEGIWPPKGIETLDAWDLPLINTLILLLSGTTVTWAHHAILQGDNKTTVRALKYTILLGLSFTALQAYEYHHAAFGFKEGIYASTFYMATGFHGAHVMIGTLFLTVCYFRAKKKQFTPEGHLGFEFAAWYWHFVDVVWLFLFLCVYVWGS